MKGIKVIASILLAVCSVNLTGCATVIAKIGYFGKPESNKNLSLSSDPYGITAIISQKNGKEVAQVVAPAAVPLDKGGSFVIDMKKEGYFPDQTSITVKKKTKINWGFWLNFAAGALFSAAGFEAYKEVQIPEDASELDRLRADDERSIALGLIVGGAVIGIGGALVDLFTGTALHTTIAPSTINLSLKPTPEFLAAEEENRAQQARIAEETRMAAAAEAKRKAEEKAAEEKAEADAKEKRRNPNGLDRSKYRNITAEDFSFDMVAGKLAAGSKVSFRAKFLTKPTGTEYHFDDVNALLTLKSNHNFVRDMPNSCFGPYQHLLLGWLPQDYVKVYMTVTKAGEWGECSVDIIDW